MWLALLPWLPLVGCASAPHRATPPAATITTPTGGTISQTGDAQQPAELRTDAATRTVPLPSGSTIVFDDRAGTITLRLSRDSTLTEQTRTDHATAARAFTPPAPPTPAQLATAAGVRWFYVAAILGVVAAGLLAWSGHGLAALKIGAGALSLPILAHFFSSDIAMTVSALLVGAGVAFLAAWHILRRRFDASPTV